MTRKIRIIVPCFDSDVTIERCISSIFNSEGVDFELYIVDDGGNTNLTPLTTKYPIEIIKTKGQDGAGKARNSGTYGFNGMLVVFIDSDVQIHPNTLAALIKPIGDNLAEATVGSYSITHYINFWQAYKNRYLAFRYGSKQRYLTNTFWSAICAVDYKTFCQLKGFKEYYLGAGPEDIDLGMELTEMGARILSVPEASGIHLAELNFISLLKNDLRKGTEDVFTHLTKRVSIRYNRHVTVADIISVILACSIPVLVLLQNYIGIGPFISGILIYLLFRLKFMINAFGEENILFIVRAFLLTYILDVTRGLAVSGGSLLFIMNILSSGRFKPFVKVSG